jgi:hypothetical protein
MTLSHTAQPDLIKAKVGRVISKMVGNLFLKKYARAKIGSGTKVPMRQITSSLFVLSILGRR